MVRSCTRLLALSLLVGVPMLVAPSRGTAQQVALATRTPRFLIPAATAGAAPIEVDAGRITALRRKVSLDLVEVPLERALDAIGRQAHIRLVYGASALPLDSLVRFRSDSLTVAAALTELLLGAPVDVLVTGGDQLTLVRRTGERVVPGSIVGRVTDAKTHSALPGATVVLERTALSATTGSDGRYRITAVAPGTYTVRARYIGYAPGSASVTVSADQEATADLALEKSVQQLNEVVTTGTVVPTEVKALPTPVSVINESEIAVQRPHSVQELFRQVVPTAVSWDFPSSPIQTAYSVRGASGLTGGAGSMKVLVDGIPLANFTGAAVDPNSVARIEVIRGPQAAAIYGSDAIGGVIQIFTKHGDSTRTRPQVEGEAALGLIQTPYAGYDRVVRQAYKASVQGNAGVGVSYQFGAGYSYTPDWAGPVSAQSNPSVYGGMHATRGALTADVAGRYYIQNNPQVINPVFAQTGYVPRSKPYYSPVQYRSETMNARLSLAVTSWWQQTVFIGVDRNVTDQTQIQPRFTTPSDSFLNLSYQDESKTSVGYNTSVRGSLGSGTRASATVGFDHYSLPVSAWSTSGALNATGDIATDPDQPASAFRTIVNNTGYFAQGQLAFRDALFLTGGVRAEQNTGFGDSLNTPLSPQAGLSYVRSIGAATVKLRGSWGRAIRPPSPGLKVGSAGPGYLIRSSPQLTPERQQGWDAGIDVTLGARGSLSATYYDQTAENLIQSVVVSTTPQLVTYQNQNVGRVKNTGLELEATVFAGPVALKGQYGYVRSRLEDLGPSYGGDQRVGDQPLFVPTHTAGASLTVAPLAGTTVAAGLAYVGSWTGYDNIARFSCFGGTGPCRPTLRDYHVVYPGFIKANATISHQFTSLVSGFLSLDNLTNNANYELLQSSPAMGRITTIGVQFHN